MPGSSRRSRRPRRCWRRATRPTRRRPSRRSSRRRRATSRRSAGLARAYLALGDAARAREILALAPKEKESDPAILAARAQVELAEASADAGEAGELAARLERDPDDHQARYDLAMALIGKGDQEGAIDALLELFRRDREWNDGAAKAQLFKLFDSLGPKSEAAQKGRRRLVFDDLRLTAPGRREGAWARSSASPTCRRRSRSFRCPARCCCRARGCRSTSSSRATSRCSRTR